MPQRRRRKKANNPKNQTALRGGFSYPVQNPTKNTVAPEPNRVPRTHSAILRRPLTIRKNHAELIQKSRHRYERPLFTLAATLTLGVWLILFALSFAKADTVAFL